MEEYIQIFNDYVKQFDLTQKWIMYKYHHSFRVMDLAESIAKSLNLNEHDIMLAKISGLLHDIGRFTQLEKYNTLKDHKSLDHGDEGYEILASGFINNFTFNEEEKEIILKSTKYHNKREYTENNERIKMFINIIRDADKLDISKCTSLAINDVTDNEIIIKEEILNQILEDQIVNYELVENDTDQVLAIISWINDYNFPFSINYLFKENILENKLQLLEIYGETKETKMLREYLNTRIKKVSEELC